MQKERATYYCIDIECSGQVPAVHDMISLGAVVVRQGENGYELGEDFYMELAPVSEHVDKVAMEINGLDLEDLRKNGLERSAAMKKLTAFVKETLDPGTEAVFVGHNAPFDWSFVTYCYGVEKLKNPFGYKALDTKAYSSGVLDIHWLDSHKGTLSERLGLSEEDMSQKHRADYDARFQAEILKALLEYKR